LCGSRVNKKVASWQNGLGDFLGPYGQPIEKLLHFRRPCRAEQKALHLVAALRRQTARMRQIEIGAFTRRHLPYLANKGFMSF
jgi:hypothetical protein